MKRQSFILLKKAMAGMVLALLTIHTSAQTEIDGIMMEKHALCIGPMFGYSSWKNYWEGTLKRNNENLGTVSTTMYSIMGNYGITKKINLLFGIPYVKTKASAGQMRGMKGIQDLSLWLKWNPYSKKIWQGRFKAIVIAGYSMPLSNYTADYLPLAIGLESRNLYLRAMADYQRGAWFGTLSGTYVNRSNITIDRNSYYTTEMHYSNKVDMPDAMAFNARFGYRNNGLIAELFLDNWTTLGGFDITRNNMPFPSNEMNNTKIGFNFKYDMPFLPQLSLTGNVATSVAGRNTGQATGFNAGIFYVMNIAKKVKKESKK
ncbi:MAG: hypothetical protein U0T68_00065 [Ferruginibacter sp.]